MCVIFIFDSLILTELQNKLQETQRELQFHETDPLELIDLNTLTTTSLIEDLEQRMELKLDVVKNHKFQVQQKQIDKLKEVLLCPICMDKQKNVSLEPCGHALCKGCANLLFGNTNNGNGKGCPLCRKTVKVIHQIYL